jgi:hypothetical protein
LAAGRALALERCQALDDAALAAERESLLADLPRA